MPCVAGSVNTDMDSVPFGARERRDRLKNPPSHTCWAVAQFVPVKQFHETERERSGCDVRLVGVKRKKKREVMDDTLIIVLLEPNTDSHKTKTQVTESTRKSRDTTMCPGGNKKRERHR